MIKNVSTDHEAQEAFKSVVETRVNRAIGVIGSIRNIANQYNGYDDTQVRAIVEALRAAVNEAEIALSANMVRTEIKNGCGYLKPEALKVGTLVRIRGNARDFDIASTLCIGIKRYDGEVDSIARVLEAPGAYDKRVRVSIDFIAGYALVDARVNIQGLELV